MKDVIRQRIHSTLFLAGVPSPDAATDYLMSIIHPALGELEMKREDEREALGVIYRRIDPDPGESISQALLRLIEQLENEPQDRD